jgi:hypothetical protein
LPDSTFGSQDFKSTMLNKIPAEGDASPKICGVGTSLVR